MGGLYSVETTSLVQIESKHTLSSGSQHWMAAWRCGFERSTHSEEPSLQLLSASRCVVSGVPCRSPQSAQSVP